MLTVSRERGEADANPIATKNIGQGVDQLYDNIDALVDKLAIPIRPHIRRPQEDLIRDAANRPIQLDAVEADRLGAPRCTDIDRDDLIGTAVLQADDALATGIPWSEVNGETCQRDLTYRLRLIDHTAPG